jgi:beta-mannosidase
MLKPFLYTPLPALAVGLGGLEGYLWLMSEPGQDLCGLWAALPGEGGLHRDFQSPSLEDSAWEGVPVPGHWREVPAFAGLDGPVLYRHRFEADAPGDGQRAWLVLEGIFYQSDIWLDGSYLGDTEGYFFPHVFEVTEALGTAREHLLAAEVACPRGDEAARVLLGSWADPSCVGRAYSPGGIWAPVRLVTTGPVRIASVRASCSEALAKQAVLEVSAVFDSAAAMTVHVVTEVRSPAGSRRGSVVALASKRLPLATGANRARWRVEVAGPELWWPAGLGPQALCEVTVRAYIGASESHSRSLRTGLRQLRWRAMALEVNGEGLFLQGADLAPTRRDIAAAGAAEVARDVELAKGAGLNLLRVKAHVARPELYDAADELGLLVWQDLPFSGPYQWAARQVAVRQAEKAVWLLCHHPSVALWCAHAEASAPVSARSGLLRRLSRRAGNLTGGPVADWVVRRALERADGSRAALAHPGSWALGRNARSGSPVTRLERAGAIWPAAARFVTGLGLASVPESCGFMAPERWPDLDWEGLSEHFAMDTGGLLGRFPPADFQGFAAWRDATQAQQAEAVRAAVEALRRLRLHPVGGFSVSRLNDAQPAVSSSLLDHERRPKAAWEVLTRSCAPLIVVASWPCSAYLAGSHASFAVHIINDRLDEERDLLLEARLSWPGGGRVWRASGTAAARQCTFAGDLTSSLPGAKALADATGGSPENRWAMRLDLQLWRRGREELLAANFYDSTIVARRRERGLERFHLPARAGRSG